MRAHAVFACVQVLALAAGGTGSPQSPAAAGEAPPYTAEVGPIRAHFVFPLMDQPAWEWCQPDTRELGLEYGWTVEVENLGQTYEFGFTLFKCLHHGPTTGSVQTLLESGQMNVWKATPPTRSHVNQAGVRVAAIANRLVVAVDDPVTLRLLFSDHPAHATFIVQRPGARPLRREAEINYVQP